MLDNAYIQDWGNACDLRQPLRFSHLSHPIMSNNSKLLDPRETYELSQKNPVSTLENSLFTQDEENNNSLTCGAKNSPKSSPTRFAPEYKLPPLALNPDIDLDQILQK